MRTEHVNAGDINAWLDLAREVEPLFGPMAGDKGFIRAVEETVAEKRAFCIRSSEGLAGVIALRTFEYAVSVGLNGKEPPAQTGAATFKRGRRPLLGERAGKSASS